MAIPQQILPIFIEGESSINEKVYYEYDKTTNAVCYYLYCLAFYTHSKDDFKSFQLVIALLINLGHCTNNEIIRGLSLSKSYVDRAVKKYRDGGTRSFFALRKVRSSPVLTPDVLAEAQQLLASGEIPGEVAQQLGLKPNTLNKAINDGRLIQKKIAASNQSERNVDDHNNRRGMLVRT